MYLSNVEALQGQTSAFGGVPTLAGATLQFITPPAPVASSAPTVVPIGDTVSQSLSTIPLSVQGASATSPTWGYASIQQNVGAVFTWFQNHPIVLLGLAVLVGAALMSGGRKR